MDYAYGVLFHWVARNQGKVDYALAYFLCREDVNGLLGDVAIGCAHTTVLANGLYFYI